MIRILIVEKNKEQSAAMRSVMREQGYEVFAVSGEEEALKLFEETDVELIIGSAASGGLELTRELRDAGETVPVILITSEESRAEKRRIFRSGADGYMAAPPDLEELVMRVQSLLWRCKVVDSATLKFGSCRLHADTLTVESSGGEIELRRMEFLLLEKLLSYPGRVFTRAQLMNELWGYDSESDPRTVDTHIRRLRKKLKEVDEIRLITVRGLGYRAAMPRRLRKAEAREKAESVQA